MLVHFAMLGLLLTIQIPVSKSSVYDYHNRIGIPVAKRIREAENIIFTDISSHQRIINGTYATMEQVPYQAGLLVSLDSSGTSISVCGGALISDRLVLTAAHCYTDGVETAVSMTVVLGSAYIFYGGRRIGTTDVVVYPEWNPSNIFNDIAVIRFSSVEFTDVIQPVTLPNDVDIKYDFSEHIGIISGYGLTRNDDRITKEQRLSLAKVTIISNVSCRLVYGPLLAESNICTAAAGGITNPCYGDSGGPLVVYIENRKFLIGIVSFGSELGCEVEFPVAYTRVTSYLPWILSIDF